MEPETAEHLNKVEEVIEQVKHLLARHGYPDNLRTVIVIGFISQMVEHHEAMLLLIRNGKIGSAFTLARSIVESMYRGMWVNYCATNAQLQEFEQNDDVPLTMTAMARAIDEQYHAEGFFERLKNRSWSTLCSYTHTGLLQLGRRFTGHNVQPDYGDGEILEVTTTVTTCILLLVGKFLAVQDQADECREAERLIETFGPAARGNSVP